MPYKFYMWCGGYLYNAITFLPTSNKGLKHILSLIPLAGVITASSFEVLVLFIICYSVLLLHYILEANTFTPQNLFESFRHITDEDLA